MPRGKNADSSASKFEQVYRDTGFGEPMREACAGVED